MKILVVDDEKLALEGLMHTLSKAAPQAEISGFRNGVEAFAAAEKESFDIAFLDIEMRQMDGITLDKKLRCICPSINIIFTTGYSEYSTEAFELHASGYITKPVTLGKVRYELSELRNPLLDSIESSTEPAKRIKIMTFGNFEVYGDGKPIDFYYNKSKELLAYMVDRNGALCSKNEIMGILWEKNSAESLHTAYLKNCRSDLIKIFEQYDCGEGIIKRRGFIAIVPEIVECDYFDWLKGRNTGANSYHGEYMSQYSWAENTHALLESGNY